MFKITVYNNNCSPVCDGTTFWFVEDLVKFKKNWLPLQCRKDVSTIEIYYKSEFGEVVTNYYCDSGIVQQIKYEILQ